MTTTLEAINMKLMLAFDGLKPPNEIVELLKHRPVGGFTLFRALNIGSASQIRALTDELQNIASSAAELPLLIAIDQEGGQFNGLGECATQFAGNMALGATGDINLAERVGYAIGRELRALGININYAPVCDINTNPQNPGLGIRAFSDDVNLVSDMSAAMVRGLQSARVVASLKHFPGKGQASVDSHHKLPLIDHTLARLEHVELVPFKAGIAAGAKLIMTGHFSIPSLTDKNDLPATLSRAVMTDFLREKLGFEGVVITDALDMKAITQGAGQVIDVITAMRAGVDLMLLTKDIEVQTRIYEGVQLAYSRGLLRDEHLLPSAERILQLKEWLADYDQPDISVVQSAEHQDLAKELSERSITLVKDEAGILPLKLENKARIAVIFPQPEDLTPADTSSYIKPSLAEALRKYHSDVDEFIVPHFPEDEQISAVRDQVINYDLIVVGTINAHMNSKQASLVKILTTLSIPLVAVALRTPYDLIAYPQVKTYLCTYSILESSMRALAKGLFGEIEFTGRLPVSHSDLG